MVLPHAAPRVTRRGLHSEVVTALGLRIVRGEYREGEVLPRTEELATQLGVSRTVVREGFRVLADKGMLVARQRAGTSVRPRDAWDLMDPDVIHWQRLAGPDIRFFRDLSEVRMAIEVRACRLAARRADPVSLDRMRAALAEMERHVADRDAYIQADLDLHAAILRATHNPLLAQLSQTITEGLVASRGLTVRPDGSMEAALPLHAAVIEAIASGDEERADGAMTRLVSRALGDLEAILGAEPR
jgi:GntR family galactonate operon transcriptional repressor